MVKYILKGKKNIIAEQIDTPSHLSQGEALVKIKYVCLCGSDYKLYREEYSGPVKYPLILGHEWSGVIEDINDPSNTFNIGDHVTCDCSGWGDNCTFKSECNYNKNTCPQVQKFGITKDGALTNYAIISIHNLYKAPSNMPLSVLALSELFSVAENSIKKSNIYYNTIPYCHKYSSDNRILITGLGAVGIAIYLLLKYKYNMNNIDLYEKSFERQLYVKSIFPNINFIESIEEDSANTYHSLLSCSPYYCIFEASGAAEAIHHSINIVNPNGTIVLVGMYPTASLNIKNIVLKSITITGSIGGTGSFPEVIQFLYKHQDMAEKMLTHAYDFNLKSINNAFNEDSLNYIKKIIKID